MFLVWNSVLALHRGGGARGPARAAPACMDDDDRRPRGARTATRPVGHPFLLRAQGGQLVACCMTFDGTRRRRLHQVALVLNPAPAAAATAVLPRFSLGADGLSAADRAEVEHRLQEALRAQDYREAASLKNVLDAFGPSHRVRLHDAMEVGQAGSLDQQSEFFLDNGFACIPAAVEPKLLARLQAAWMRKSAIMEPLWRQRVAVGATSNPRGKVGRFESRVSARAFDMPTADFFAGADGRTLLEVVALPKVISLLEKVVAPRPRLRLCGVQARTVIPQPVETFAGYTNWHTDSSSTDGWPHPHERIVKVFLPLFDVTVEGGPSAVVPGTHRLPETPAQVAKFGTRGGLQQDKEGLPPEAMPNYVAFAVPAGTACMMDQCIWHAALPNTSAESRRQLIIGYQPVTRRGGTGAIPSAADVRQYEATGGALPEEITELLGDDAHKAIN